MISFLFNYRESNKNRNWNIYADDFVSALGRFKMVWPEAKVTKVTYCLPHPTDVKGIVIIQRKIL